MRSRRSTKKEQAQNALDAVQQATTASRFLVVVAYPKKGGDTSIEIHPWKGTNVDATQIIEQLAEEFGLSMNLRPAEDNHGHQT